MRTIKIFGSDAQEIAARESATVIARYPAFVVVTLDDAKAIDLARTSLVEDITDQYALRTTARPLDTAVPRVSSDGALLEHPSYDTAAPLPPGPHHYIVQFVAPIKKSWLTALRKAGGEVVAPFEGFAVIARIDGKDVAAVAKLKTVRWLGHLPYDERLSDRVLAQVREAPHPADPATPRSRYLPETYTVQFFRGDLAKVGRRAVRKLGFEIVDTAPDAATLIVRPKADDPATVQNGIGRLSRVHGVQRIALRPVRRISNDRAAIVMATADAAAAPPPGLGLSGEGEIIGICDTGLDSGDPATIHPDFTGRIAAIKSYPITPDFDQYISNPGGEDGAADLDSGHGTHTSGSIVGDGTASAGLPGLAGPIRGLSFKARLVFQAVEQRLDWKSAANARKYGRYLLAGIPADLTELFDYAYGKGARIHSNSWGGGDPGDYDEQSRQTDAYIWAKPDFCVLFAAGNDGRDGDADGVIDLGSVTPPGTAKNIITVGASENNRPEFTLTYGAGWPQDYPAAPISGDRLADDPDDMAAFSSRGPTADGRIKPDVVAPGTYVLSTRSRFIAENNFGYGKFGSSKDYMFDSGTSMATPLTAGAVGLVREYLRTQVQIAAPSAALLKASLIAGAVPIAGAAVTPDDHQGFGRVALDPILAPRAPSLVRFVEGPALATGAMHELAVSVGTDGMPLKVVLAYSDFPGPRLVNNLNLVVVDPAGTNHVGNAQGGTGFDAVNNVEVVTLPAAAAGAYRVQVFAANVPSGPQPFALVLVGALLDAAPARQPAPARRRKRKSGGAGGR